MAILNGTSGNDTIEGTDDRDEIRGGEGNDALRGNGGDDRIFGEEGDDRLEGGDGRDYLSGGTGNDVVRGGTGDDTLIYVGGNDILDGQAGSNTLIIDFAQDAAGNVILDLNNRVLVSDLGNAQVYNITRLLVTTGDGDDTIIGSDRIVGPVSNDVIDAGDGNNRIEGLGGSDRLTSGIGDDYIDGGDHNDTIDAGDGNNTVLGGDGSDRITTGIGNDVIDAGADNDTIVVGGGVDQIDGGEGIDTLRIDTLYDGTGRLVEVDAENGTFAIDGAVSAYTNIERFDISSGAADDVILTGEGDDRVIDIGGTNLIETLGGNDTVTVREGSSVVRAGSGDDLLRIAGNSNQISPEPLPTFADLDGGDGNDTLDAGIIADATLDAAAGTISWDLGNAEFGNIENFTINAFGDNDLVGSNGTNRFNTGDGDDRLIGGAQADYLYAGRGTNSVEGGGGNDYISAQAGNDFVSGGDGNDVIYVDSGGNEVFGGTGNDRITVGGISEFAVSTETNMIDAGEGNDTISLQDYISVNLEAGEGSDTVNFFAYDRAAGITSNLNGGDGPDALYFRFDSPSGKLGVEVSFLNGTASWGSNTIQFSNFELYNFTTGDGDDTFIAGMERVFVTAGDGDDKFYAGSGEGLFSGGAGFDQYFLSGNFADYELSLFQLGNYAIFENADGTRFAGAVEEFVFNDGVYDVATGEFTATEISNTPPEALNDTASADEDGATSANVLANDSDADGDAIEVITVNGLPVGTPIIGLYGTLMLAADGSFTYTADQPGADRLDDGTSADDVFTYEVSDGEASSTASLTVTVTAVADGRFVVGTDGDDVLPGGDLDDVIDGLGGDDRLLGGDGDDLLDGGTGNDRLNGGEDDDTLFGGDGNDILFGNDGDDVLVGGNGDDLMVGHAGADVFVVGGDAGSHDIIRDFETGVDSLELADDASIIAILEASSGTTLSLSDGSSVTLNGISDVDLAEILEPLAAEQQVEALLSNFTDGVAQDATVFQAPVEAGSILDQAIEPGVAGFAGPMTDAMEDHAIPEPLIA